MNDLRHVSQMFRGFSRDVKLIFKLILYVDTYNKTIKHYVKKTYNKTIYIYTVKE